MPDEGLPRVDASGFRQRISTIPLALVLMCIPSDDRCSELDVQLSQIRATLLAERSPVALRLLDVSGEAGAALRAQYALDGQAPVYVFRRGAATPYAGPPHSVDILKHLRKLAAGEEEKSNAPRKKKPLAPVSQSAELGRPLPTPSPSKRSPQQQAPQLQHVLEPRSPTGSRETDSVTELTEPALLPLTPAGFDEALKAHPLLLVLFIDRHRRAGRNFLLSNFSAAAEVLASHSVPITLGWMQVSGADTFYTLSHAHYTARHPATSLGSPQRSALPPVQSPLPAPAPWQHGMQQR
jgi:hypothetical protein